MYMLGVRLRRHDGSGRTDSEGICQDTNQHRAHCVGNAYFLVFGEKHHKHCLDSCRCGSYFDKAKQTLSLLPKLWEET